MLELWYILALSPSSLGLMQLKENVAYNYYDPVAPDFKALQEYQI